MKREEILRLAIEKAIKNGYHAPGLEMIPMTELSFSIYENRVIWSLEKLNKGIVKASIYGTIFSHDFAKAFWGKERFTDRFGEERIKWVSQLQIMVLAEDPISYLSQFIDEDL